MGKKLLVICGPTATGKTALAVQLAKKFSGEIVSADSRQVYKGMDIGTGKDVGNVKCQSPLWGIPSEWSNVKSISNNKFQIGYYEIDGVRVWLYDVVEPDYRFSVADYVRCASLLIKDIWRREKLPVLVGGTGFYIKGLINGIETLGISPDWKLREKLRNLEIEKLREILEKINPKQLEGMNESDRNNPRRLIRAIEIAAKYQISNIKYQKDKLKIKNILFIGLTASYKFLYQRIDKRVEERVRQGVVEEIKSLLKKGYNWENSALGTTIGYKEWKDFFGGKISQEEVIKRWQYAEHAYARRQMTWFKKEKRIVWFDISQKNWQNKVNQVVENWYGETASL